MEAVIFDMDGVIVDTEPGFYIVANQFLERYGKSITKEYFEFTWSNNVSIEGFNIISLYLL